MSDKPEKAVQSLVKLHSQIEKTMKLEKHGMMAADDYADKAESVLMDFISFLTVDEKYNIKRNLRPGGKIYRGLSAVLFVQDGKDAKDEFMRNYLSDKAKSCISFTGPVHQLLFDKLFPVEAKQYKDQVMDETNPFRTDLSEQEVNDIKAAFFALEKVK
ncbi:hypothetical protein NX722_22735 [Endozoicomonas gorgoniicola]|uniref:Uncharacterized protein n=1 Tax=Endozoicomonas gorgoniicola TaxID=1234144 RepID=A0ABT3N191_9GAMM|nr:hypothetical protein [Endozoicomonas gorgoniicola]MCW7555396.1 hypothetical protein [Endozoicomonas gorgoniicola]